MPGTVLMLSSDRPQQLYVQNTALLRDKQSSIYETLDVPC